MILLPQLPIDPRETLLSYTDRLSLMHTGRGMERLLRDRGIRTEHFISGRADAVIILAEATGHAVEDLQLNAVRVSQRCASFRGEDISKPFLSPRAARYCPLCVDGDGPSVERRFRVMWGFRRVCRCDYHSIRLADSPDPVATNLRVELGSSPLARSADADGETPDYLCWLRKRIHVRSVAHLTWLDG